MTLIDQTGATRIARDFSSGEYIMVVEQEAITEYEGEPTSPTQFERNDALMQEEDVPASRQEAVIAAAVGGDIAKDSDGEDATFQSLDPDIATVDAVGRVSWVSNGMARILVATRMATKMVRVPVSRTEASTKETWIEWLDDTPPNLSKALFDHAVNAVTGKSVQEAMNQFASADYGAGTFTRNPDFFDPDLDVTVTPPWNSNNYTKGGALISPRHFVHTKHWGIPTGTTIRFVAADNSVVDRTLTANQGIADSDIQVGVLDSDVPASIGFAKLLPADWLDYLPEYKLGHVIAYGFDPQGRVMPVQNISLASFAKPVEEPLASFYYDPFTSENLEPSYFQSGHPALSVIGSDTVLWTLWTVLFKVFEGSSPTADNLIGTSLNGNAYASFIDEINAAMTSLGGGYQVTTVDLSGFQSYA